MTDNTNNNVISFDRSADFYYRHALEKRKNNRLDEALVYLRKASSIESNPETDIEIADILSEMGLYHESNAHLITAFPSPDERSPEVVIMMCDNYLDQGENLQAAITFLKYFKHTPNTSIYAGNLYSFSTLAGAFDLNTFLFKYENIEPDVPGYVLNRARTLMMQCEYEEAIVALERFIPLFPDDITFLSDMIFALMMVHGYFPATQAFNKLSASKTKPNFLLACAFCMIANLPGDADPEFMKFHISELIKYNTQTPYETYVAAETLIELGYADKARDHAKRLVNMFPYSPIILHTYAATLYACKDYKGAADQYSKILRILPDDFLTNSLRDACINAKNKVPTHDQLPCLYYPPEGTMIGQDDYINYHSRMVKCVEPTAALNALDEYDELFPDLSKREQKLRELLLVKCATFDIKNRVLDMLIDMGANPPYAVATDCAIIENSPKDMSVFNSCNDALKKAALKSLHILEEDYGGLVTVMNALDIWEYYIACMQYSDFTPDNYEKEIAAAVAFKAAIRCDHDVTDTDICESFNIKRESLAYGINILGQSEDFNITE